MLKELVQELNQNLANIEALTKENGKLKTEKETINSQLLAANESLRAALEKNYIRSGSGYFKYHC